MTCPVCGKPYPCPHSRRNTAVLLEPEVSGSADLAVPNCAPHLPSPAEVLDRSERERWRQEVISRVQQHRARRRRRFDPSASLDLEFPAEETTALYPAIAPEQMPVLQLQEQEEDERATIVSRLESSVRPVARPPKIIRFPRQSPLEAAGAFRPPREDLELAEPVQDAPRILDAPEAEQMELLSSFADIHLGPPPSATSDMSLPPQPAPLLQRALSGLTDAAIVLAAAAMFASTFLKLAETIPASRLTWLYALAVGATLWLMFQYIFLVYGQGTPGMRAASLELCNFNGSRASRFARRCRALATTLSGFSLGLGFAWSFVDEDTLGWHDRISGTYLRSVDRAIG